MKARACVGVALLGSVALLGGCLPGGDPGCPTCPGGGSPVRVELRFEAVEQGAQSGIRDARGVVVRDEETWAALWREHAAGQDPRPPVPEVDFAQEMVVGFFLGERPTGGYSVEIVRITRWPDQLVVRVVVTQPAPGEIVPQVLVLTQPFHLVRAERAEVSAVFETVER